MPGASPTEALCKLRRLRRAVRADVVVLVLSFNDAFSWPRPCDEAEAPAAPAEPGEPAPLGARLHAGLRDFVLGHSHLGVLLAYRTNALLIRAGLRPRFAGMASVYDPQTYRDHAVLVARTTSILQEVLGDARADGAEAVLVYVPGLLEADDVVWESAQRLEGRRLSRGLPREHVLGAGRAAGFAHVVAPPADASGRTGMHGLYFPLDMHLTPAGNAYVADLVVEALGPVLIERAARKEGAK